MSKINLLSSKIYNRIAAGEVVDRPYSVVKELVENSIDAGATSITVEIINGGITSISILDNGTGIEKDQLRKAILPHATSKISKLDDLDDIKSLGFRGEALPSIASVSKLKIESKTASSEMGAYIYLEGGEVIELEDNAMSNGTCVTVKNLFYNTPAREKFLKSPRSEESEISSTMARFILGNPNVAFKYIADGEVIYQSFGDGLESAFVNVYGSNVIKDCFYIDTEKNGISIKGYISKHHFTKGNRSSQTIFLNGRYIVNQTISLSIANAYSSYLMKHRYPFYVLCLTIPSSIVDVNVHPNKLDVRFQNNQIIYGSVYSVISKVLDGSNEALNIVKSDTFENNKAFTNDLTNDYVTHNTVNKPTNTSFPKFEPLVFNDVEISDNIDAKKENAVDIFAENKAYLEKLEREKNNKTVEIPKQTEIQVAKNLRYIGQALNTFLVLDDGEDLFLVDQHAAHERILYDKLICSVEKNSVPIQPLLIPYVLNLSNEEFDFMLNNVESLKQLGLNCQEFGKNSIKVDSVPIYLSNMNLEGFFKDILNDLYLLKSLSTASVLKEKLAQKACKSAIKSGDTLDNSQVVVLLEKLKQNLGLKCPHGRPVAIKISRVEIDKWFKRII